MKTYVEEIKDYCPFNELEKNDREMMEHIISVYGDKALYRDNLAHFTASSMILNKDRTRVLMVYHNIYESYSWTGGHMDGEIYPLNTAIKEAKEETGISSLKLISDGLYSLEIIPVRHHVKKGKVVSDHLHLNFTYLFEADENESLHIKEDENKDVKWLDIENLEDYISENDKLMIPIYRKELRDYGKQTD